MKSILTASDYNGIQVSLEVKRGDRWCYIAVGCNDGRLSGRYGSATPEDVTDDLRTLARSRGEEPARYAASHRGTENSRDLFDIDLW